jgi:predicted phosphodiesterase
MTSSLPARLTWLHLSDFHLREKMGWSQDQVLRSLLDDIRTRYSRNDRPDLLFLTGDIAFSGKDAEYTLAEDFVLSLRDATQVPPDRICLVPGNHDIDRDKEEDAAVGARVTLTNGEAVDRFFGNEGRHRTLFARQKAFRDFANRISPSSPAYTDSSHAHCKTLEIGDLRIRVLLLDSAWLAGGGPSDVGELLVGERQVIDCGPADDGFLTFALLHHPLAWLREFEQVSIENLLTRDAHICLRGHVHAVDVRRTESRLGGLNTFTAGAAFQSRTADNSYLWCSIDLTTGSGEKIVHRYLHAQHRWEASEKEEWKLRPSALQAPNVAEVHQVLVDTCIAYPSYVACLVCGLKTEVPIVLTGKLCMFVGCEVTLPNSSNRCGEAVQKLRNHFYWQRVWKAESWTSHMHHLSGELAGAFRQLEKFVSSALQSQEQACVELLHALRKESDVVSPVCNEIASSLERGDIGRARELVDRWLGADLLRADEALQFKRLEVQLLLAESRPTDALACANILVDSQDKTPDDVALAALVAHNVKDFARAAFLMHLALDLGIRVVAVREIALKIAGSAGDKNLTNRVIR